MNFSQTYGGEVASVPELPTEQIPDDADRDSQVGVRFLILLYSLNKLGVQYVWCDLLKCA